MRYLPVSALILVIAVFLFFTSTPVGVAHTRPIICSAVDCECKCVATFNVELDLCGISHEQPDLPPPPISDFGFTECVMTGVFGEAAAQFQICILACHPQEHE